MQDRLLIIGASSYQHYIYTTAKQMGFRIYSIDGNANAPMFKLANDYSVIDIYDVDRIVQYALKNRVSLVTSINLDQGMSAVNRMKQLLGLPHKEPDVIERATKKDLMRETWRDAGVNIPEYWVFDRNYERIIELVKKTDFPLIIKPVDNAAKRGISILQRDANLLAQINEALSYSKCGRVIVEEYIDGQMYFVPTYVSPQGNIITGLMDQDVLPNMVQVGSRAPSKLGFHEAENVVQEAIKAAHCFGPGFYHTEVLYSKERRVVVIETSPRISYATVALTRLIYGFDPVAQLLADESGFTLNTQFSLSSKIGCASLIHLIPPPNYIRRGNPHIQSLWQKNVYEVVSLVPEGHVVTPFLTNGDRVMYFVAFANDELALRQITNTVKDYLIESCFELPS
jgi:biotin carboxylase